MVQQLAHRDMIPMRKVGDVSRDGTVDLNLPLLDEPQHGGRRERLAHRSDAEPVVDSNGNPATEVRFAEGGLKQHGIARRDENRAAEIAHRHVGCEKLVYIGGETVSRPSRVPVAGPIGASRGSRDERTICSSSRGSMFSQFRWNERS